MAAESGRLRVFISSTCFDLRDLRAELRLFLEDNGMSVALSEDPNSPFIVDPLEDSIESCLDNVSASDAVVCIIDRRYGGVINTGEHEGLSATHAEIRRARDNQIPMFFFLRNYAWQDYEQLRKNDSYSPNWMKEKGERKQKWFDMVKECSKLPTHGSMSNWCDQFQSSVDLKLLVVKRLLDCFPQYTGASALQPDHLVRIHFVMKESGIDGKVKGHFRNVGVGPALDIYHGFRIGETARLVETRGALGESENIKSKKGKEYCYDIPPNEAPVLFCEYNNRFGERYRVEVLLAWSEEGYITSGEEKFFPLAPAERIV
ncbi:MAG: DUF4062 domain-containing protein [Zavarzinella sp.]